jgi:hypothetical protein
MKRKEQAHVHIPGLTASGELEIDVLVCNRCGTKVLPARATERAWVHVLSDGRGGKNLDFCEPRHAAEYFRELTSPESDDRELEFVLASDADDEPTSRNGAHALPG